MNLLLERRTASVRGLMASRVVPRGRRSGRWVRTEVREGRRHDEVMRRIRVEGTRSDERQGAVLFSLGRTVHSLTHHLITRQSWVGASYLDSEMRVIKRHCTFDNSLSRFLAVSCLQTAAQALSLWHFSPLAEVVTAPGVGQDELVGGSRAGQYCPGY